MNLENKIHFKMPSANIRDPFEITMYMLSISTITKKN